jgi:hypothetical protein
MKEGVGLEARGVGQSGKKGSSRRRNDGSTVSLPSSLLARAPGPEPRVLFTEPVL